MCNAYDCKSILKITKNEIYILFITLLYIFNCYVGRKEMEFFQCGDITTSSAFLSSNTTNL